MESEALRNKKEVGENVARLGDIPFTSMGITKNDKRFAHKDDKDSKMGFILWFLKGTSFQKYE
jgi:hypothetical protein